MGEQRITLDRVGTVQHLWLYREDIQTLRDALDEVLMAASSKEWRERLLRAQSALNEATTN